MDKDNLRKTVSPSARSERLVALLSDVERLKQEYVNSSWGRFSRSFFKIATESAIRRKEAQEANAATASRLNVFELLKVANLERYHTRLLGDLLHPNGSHGQGKLFLKFFADIVFPPSIRDHVHDANDIVTSIEYDTYFGRLDILIASRTKRFLVVIENKIGTTDTPGQIDRYCNWLERQTNTTPDRRLLLYLTPEGEPSEYRTDGYVPISYKKQVNDWLLRSMAEPLPPKLASLLQQYAETIALMRTGDSYEGTRQENR
ncbi:MAG: PD-(D/E)XK nuclease family protein [Candidatus Binataceae bacterium]